MFFTKKKQPTREVIAQHNVMYAKYLDDINYLTSIVQQLEKNGSTIDNINAIMHSTLSVIESKFFEGGIVPLTSNTSLKVISGKPFLISSK